MPSNEKPSVPGWYRWEGGGISGEVELRAWSERSLIVYSREKRCGGLLINARWNGLTWTKIEGDK